MRDSVNTQSSALTGRRQLIQQRLLDGASGAEAMDALTELIDGLIIGRYRNGLRQLGEAGRKRVIKNYTNEIIARQLVAFFRQL